MTDTQQGPPERIHLPYTDAKYCADRWNEDEHEYLLSTPEVRAAKELERLLRDARQGLAWYIGNAPEYVSTADFEKLNEIDALLDRLEKERGEG